MSECAVFGRAPYPDSVCIGFDKEECYRIGYERQRTRAEAAEADFQTCSDELDLQDSDADREKARADRLEAALKLYGRHLASPECGAYRGTSDRDCTCGLAAALAGEEGK